MTEDMDILELMRELGALKSGHFQLSSGRHSDTYFQCAQILQFPDLAREVGRRIAALADANEIDVVVAPALGAVLLGHEVARALGRRFVFTERKEGAMTMRRGFALEPGEKVMIVEDVVTRGTSTREVVDIVTAEGGVVTAMACLVDRTDDSVELPGELRSLAKVAAVSWAPEECPLCADGKAIESPGSRRSN